MVFVEKAIFEAAGSEERNELIFSKAQAYKSINNFEEAIKCLERLNPSSLTDSMRFELFYELALNQYLCSAFQKAGYNVLLLENLTKNPQQQLRQKLVAVLCYNAQHKWTEAEQAFLSFENLSNESADSIKNYYHNLRSLKLKSLRKAENLSYFLPGVGQMYAGKFFRGLTSSVIQIGLLSFAGYSILNGYYFSGTLTGVSLFYVFYLGGARHAVYLAEEYNKSLIKENVLEVNSYLFKQIKKR